MAEVNRIVCLTHNGLQYTREAYKSFLAQDIPTRVLFVDTGSTDGTIQWLFSLRDGPYCWYRLGSSVAHAWNSALNLAFDKFQEPYLLIVNNDVCLRPETYRLLLEDGGLFVSGVAVEDKAKALRATPNTANRSSHPSFSCFLIRRECWQRVGGFDEHFAGAYCEDSDYHVRMHRLGIRAYAIDVPFYHVGSGTLKSVDEHERRRIQKQADANRAYFKSIYGCEPWEAEKYDALFSEETFGIDATPAAVEAESPPVPTLHPADGQ